MAVSYTHLDVYKRQTMKRGQLLYRFVVLFEAWPIGQIKLDGDVRFHPKTVVCQCIMKRGQLLYWFVVMLFELTALH